MLIQARRLHVANADGTYGRNLNDEPMPVPDLTLEHRIDTRSQCDDLLIIRSADELDPRDDRARIEQANAIKASVDAWRR